ncbi:MAG: glycoside hydrolase family 172 protein [bacterium]
MEHLYTPHGLGGLPMITDAETRSISAENPNGAKSGGAKSPPLDKSSSDLGEGWKCRPCITLPKESVTTLAEIAGSGVIQHIWITVPEIAYRDCILRFYWDDEEKPSVEVPLGDFFANGHGLRYDVNSMMICVNPWGGFNSYWPMPFRKSARITIENQRWEDIGGFFYQITYSLTAIPEQAGCFHAQWRHSVTSRENPQHTILDGARGAGHYVGTFAAWTQMSNGWWGEGEIKFFMDGDTHYPTICGTGTEDYFGGAWCFADRTYSTPFLGYPLFRREPNEVPRHGLYRWHVLDPIRFKKDLKVTIQALGWWPSGQFQPLTDDIATVACWYQTEPHADYPVMQTISQRWSR